ncbi:MAG: hypothetical protein ACXADB_10650 [Candidatus Hermodarchaeia archaeon]|jgi:hypothetical protein
MKDDDQLVYASPILITQTFGLLGVFGGVALLYIALDEYRAFTLPAIVIMFSGSLMLLLRRIHLINRRKLIEGTYLGFFIPFRGISRTLLKLTQRSIKSFDRVTVRHEETNNPPEPGMNLGPAKEYYVELANDQSEIRLATFYSRGAAEKRAEEIKTFLYRD